MDVFRDRIVLYPGEKTVTASDIGKEGTELDELLRRVEEHRDDEYIVMVLRPRSGQLAGRLTEMIRKRGVEVAQKLYEGGALRQ